MVIKSKLVELQVDKGLGD